MIAVESDFNVLVIEDNSKTFESVEDYLVKGFADAEITRAATLDDVKTRVSSSKKIDVILLSFTLNDRESEKLVREVRQLAKKTPIILLVDQTAENMAAKVSSYGAADYLLKSDLSASLLYKCISYCVEREKSLARAYEAEEKYKSLFQFSPLPKWIYDVETMQFVNVNEAAVRVYGYSKEEFLNMTILDIRPPEDRDEIKARVEAVRKKGRFSQANFRHRKKNGDIIVVQIESNDIEFDGRKCRLVLSIDLTERLKSEKALMASEKRFKSLIQEGGDLITILTPEGIITYASPNHETVLGYKNADLIGKNIVEFIHQNDYHRTIRLYKILLKRTRIFTSQFRFLHKNGGWLWLESIASNTLSDDSVKGFIINSRDVTARVENEKRIKETNDRFESIVKATSDAIYDFDYATDKIYIAGVNYHTLFGYKFENDRTDLEFFKSKIHPDDVAHVYECFNESVQDPRSNHFEVEYRFLRSDGSYANILDRFNIIWNNGVPVKKIGAMQDISMRKFQETVLAFEKEIYELNANPKISFDTVINKVVTNIESLIAGSLCTILSLIDDNTVRHIAGNSIDYNYIRAIDGLEIGPVSGSCGTAMYTGKSVFVNDIDNDPLWKPFLPVVQPYGFKSCWSIPVKKRTGKVMAAFAVYFKSNRSPRSEEISLLERVSHLIGVLIENRNAFEETESAKERYDIVAKATSDTIWDWKIQENRFEWNKGIQGVFGYKKEQIGKTSNWWFERVHPEDSIRVSVKLYNFLEEKVEKWQDEYRFACADGTYKYVFDRGFLVKDETGKPIRMIGAMQDVTKQKEEEQRLKLLETVVTQTKDSVIITQSEKSSASIPKIVFVNPAFTQMTGYKAKEVIGKSPAVFMGRKSVANEITKLSEALKTKKEFKFETFNLRKNGEEYWVNFSMIPITNKEGEHSHWISIQRDITEEKKQEKEKEQLIRELTQNNKDLKQFSYITSHNLRAPLSNLTGLLNLIEDIPVDNPELKEVLDGFSKSTHLLNETINDLVKVIIIKDNPSIETEEVLIQDIFENVFNQLSFLISLHKPIIRIELGKVSILNINKAYLESILLNLLTNAIKYRSTSRQLRISITSKGVGNNIVLIFKDNGIGIDLERNADKIFGLYQRFHNYPDSKGLGLYLVKSQVESMGGTITVQSEVNKGTTFTLTFKNRQ
ncbi:MAG: PAS domain S-box protein [Flavobacterium sp.]|nr:MAG: PAS domain S-box protein [Flavobacterium sp.]